MGQSTFTTPATTSEVTEARWGRDLVLIDCESGGVPATATGDWPTLAGRPNLHAAHRRRATTQPGQLVWRPDYGGGMQGFVGRPADQSHLVQLGSAVRVNALRDRRLDEVQAGVRVDAQGRVIVELEVRPRGEPDSSTVTVISEA